MILRGGCESRLVQSDNYQPLPLSVSGPSEFKTDGASARQVEKKNNLSKIWIPDSDVLCYVNYVGSDLKIPHQQKTSSDSQETIVKKRLIVGILVMAMLLVSFIGCDFLGLTVTKEWTLSGTIDIRDTTTTTTDDYRLAAYYAGSGWSLSDLTSDTLTAVSDVATVTDGGTFELSIDTTGISPSDGDYIHLLVFIDVDGDGALSVDDKYDDIETTDSDTAFPSQSWPYYTYNDESTDTQDRGWTVDDERVTDTEGADLEQDSTSFSTFE